MFFGQIEQLEVKRDRLDAVVVQTVRGGRLEPALNQLGRPLLTHRVQDVHKRIREEIVFFFDLGQALFD